MLRARALRTEMLCSCMRVVHCKQGARVSKMTPDTVAEALRDSFVQLRIMNVDCDEVRQHLYYQ
jgi:hypothetical protein